jgi:hypothetical protein
MRGSQAADDSGLFIPVLFLGLTQIERPSDVPNDEIGDLAELCREAASSPKSRTCSTEQALQFRGCPPSITNLCSRLRYFHVRRNVGSCRSFS